MLPISQKKITRGIICFAAKQSEISFMSALSKGTHSFIDDYLKCKWPYCKRFYITITAGEIFSLMQLFLLRYSRLEPFCSPDPNHKNPSLMDISKRSISGVTFSDQLQLDWSKMQISNLKGMQRDAKEMVQILFYEIKNGLYWSSLCGKDRNATKPDRGSRGIIRQDIKIHYPDDFYKIKHASLHATFLNMACLSY